MKHPIEQGGRREPSRVQRGILWTLCAFFIARILLALWAWVTGFEGVGGYWGGPQTWMLVLWFYVCLPVGLFFVGYTVYLVVRGRWRHRLLGATWALSCAAVAAE